MHSYKYKTEVDCFCKVFISKTLRYFYGLIIILIVFFMWKVIDLIKIT